MQTRRTLPLLVAGLALLATPALALDDKRIILRLGGMLAKADGRVSAAADFEGVPLVFSEPYDFGDAKLVPRADGEFRLGNRHRILASYMRYERKIGAALPQDVSGGGFTIPAGSSAELDASADVASLVYEFAVVETRKFSFGLQAGAEYARLRGQISGQIRDARFEFSDSVDGVSPVIGARFTAAPAPSWRVEAQGRYFDAQWGDFGDFEGGITTAAALVEHRFTPNLGLHVGYEWMRIDVKRGGDLGVAKIRHEFKGPTAGLTLAF